MLSFLISSVLLNHFCNSRLVEKNLLITNEKVFNSHLGNNANEFAIILTGGDGPSPVSVQILHENGTSWCSLPDLPEPGLSHHTQSGLVACGDPSFLAKAKGSERQLTKEACFTFSNGSWIRYDQNGLIHQRFGHTSWKRENGDIVLMGGGHSDADAITSEIITKDGLSEKSFDLNYPYWDACSIQLQDSVILTGGWRNETRSVVAEYDMQGWMRDLPELNQGRASHSCGHFINDHEQMVYLVVSGFRGFEKEEIFRELQSTEFLVEGGETWLFGKNLRPNRQGPCGVSISNKFIISGGYTADVDYDMSEIVVFEPKNSNNITWNKTGRLKIHSSFAGCSLIDQNTIQEILPFCKP